MKFLLIQHYKVEGLEPMSTWPPGDAAAHIEAQRRINDELRERGEFVEAHALTERATTVFHDGSGTPVVTDGPYPESKELLAGYRIVDVESLDRAVEIAAETSATPGPNGVPIKMPIEVREIMWEASSEL